MHDNFQASCGDWRAGRKRPCSSLVCLVRKVPCFQICSCEEAALAVSHYIEVLALTSCMLATNYSQWLSQLLWLHCPWYACNVVLQIQLHVIGNYIRVDGICCYSIRHVPHEARSAAHTRFCNYFVRSN